MCEFGLKHHHLHFIHLLQILPGKIEFTYFPVNCQSVLILPLSRSRNLAVAMGTNEAKVLKLEDLVKLRALAAALDTFLTQDKNEILGD